MLDNYIKITTQLNFKEYLSLQYTLTYSNGWLIWVSLCGLAALLGSIMQLFGLMDNYDKQYWGLFFGILVLIFPWLIYRTAKRNFKTHQILQEEISYDFFPDRLVITSSYSNSEIPWKKIYKIKELKNWFLIYQSDRIANLISKSCLSPEEVLSIRYILSGVSGPKLKLRKN